jgi:hypothetical protein
MSAKTHLKVFGNIVCGSVPVVVAYGVSPEEFSKELPNLRCKRCEKSIAGETVLRRADKRGSQS